MVQAVASSSVLLLIVLSVSCSSAKTNLRKGGIDIGEHEEREMADFFGGDDEDGINPATNDVDQISPRIVNGNDAQRDRYPYFTSVYADAWWGPPSHSCGGSLIHRDMVLCAAHCAPASDSVRVGAYTENDYYDRNGGQLPFHDSPIRRKIIHPRYNTNNLNYDFALFRIDPVNDQELLDSMIKLDCTRRVDSSLDSSSKLHAMGMGRIYTNGPLAPDLQEVELKFVPNCNSYFNYGWGTTITDQMMCAMERGQDSCQGDSGGPLIFKGNDERGRDDCQVGIVSWGQGGCASGSPGVYSRIAAVEDWIKTEICRNSRFPPSSCSGGAPSPTPRPPSPTPGPPNPSPAPRPTPAPETCERCFLWWCWEVVCT